LEGIGDWLARTISMRPGLLICQMDDTSDTDSRASAFIAAALVLVALPLVILIGVVAIALATYAGLVPGLGDVFSGKAPWLGMTLLAVWVLAAVGGVLVFAVRIARRSA